MTDQKQVDVRSRGWGEVLGRIWMVSFLDVRSFRAMGYWFDTVLSSDTVMRALAVAIARHGIPRALHMDMGKEFTCKAFAGGVRKIKGETLFRDTTSVCKRLGIEPIVAIGRNPQSKTIERWHREVAKFDHRIPGWCGSNTDERPEALAEFERQHQEWLEGRRPGTPLWTIGQYTRAFAQWAEIEWNAEHKGRGKYLRGLTPNRCWNVNLPEDGPRRITREQLELAVADHRVEKVAHGGQINVKFHGETIEYHAPELFLRLGQQVEVVISRAGSLSRITVLDKPKDGRFLCIAKAKPLMHWGMRTPDDRVELRNWLRARNAARKALNMGNPARRVLEVASAPAQVATRPAPERMVSSTEFKLRGLRGVKAPPMPSSGELARDVFGKDGI